LNGSSIEIVDVKIRAWVECWIDQQHSLHCIVNGHHGTFVSSKSYGSDMDITATQPFMAVAHLGDLLGAGLTVLPG